MGMHLHRRHSSHGRRGDSESSSGTGTIPPKGCMAIRVVGPGGEGPERFVVPVGYLNHPLFVGLLKEAEEEFGFEQKGAITIPCGVEQFRRVQGIIAGDHVSPAASVAAGHHHHHHGHHHGHHHFHIAGCFRA